MNNLDFLLERGTSESRSLHFINLLTVKWMTEDRFIKKPYSLIEETDEGMKALSFHLRNVYESKENEELMAISMEAISDIITNRPGALRFLMKFLLDSGFEKEAELFLKDFFTFILEADEPNIIMEELKNTPVESMLIANGAIDLAYSLALESRG